MKYRTYVTKTTVAILMFSLFMLPGGAAAQKKSATQKITKKKTTILYGQASFYAVKFQGRKTANGEKFNHSIYTGACNMLPLGTWVRVTNLKNGKTVVVKVNDRLHAKTKRLIDLTKTAAQKLGFVKAGLTRVKVEVLSSKDAK